MIRDSEIDGLSQEAANLSYEKFAQSVQSLSKTELLISDIHSTFIALHGFVAHYRHYVKNYEEAKEAVDVHAKFLGFVGINTKEKLVIYHVLLIEWD